MKAIIFCILFAIIVLVAFALIAPFLPTAEREKRAQAAFPFLVTVGGPIGYLVGMRADRLHKLRKEWLERARQNGELTEKKRGLLSTNIRLLIGLAQKKKAHRFADEA